MVELAKESTTMRRVLDPMLVYFDFRQHWAPERGLAMIVLSRMAYFMENSGTIPLTTFQWICCQISCFTFKSMWTLFWNCHEPWEKFYIRVFCRIFYSFSIVMIFFSPFFNRESTLNFGFCDTSFGPQKCREWSST